MRRKTAVVPRRCAIGLACGLLAGTLVAQARPGDDLVRARQELASGHLQEARKAAASAVQGHPEDARGWELLGIVATRLSDYAAGHAALLRALALAPHSSAVRDDLGNNDLLAGQPRLAETEFRRCLQENPRDATANYNLGLLLLLRGAADQAIPYLQRVQPATQESQLALLRTEFAAGRTAAGLELAQQLSNRFPNDARLHFSEGVVLAAARQYARAAWEFEHADALRPGTFEILHNLASAYDHEGQPDRAASVAQRALALRPDSVSTLGLLAQIDADEGKDREAFALLVKARQMAPDNTDVIFLMARLSMKESFFADAAQLLEQGVKIAPRRADLHAALGESLFMAGDTQKATLEFERLLKIDPSAQSEMFLGLCYLHLGQLDKAASCFLDGVHQDPRHIGCLYNLGLLADRRADYAEAEQWYTRALEVDPRYYDALYALASLRFEQRRYAEAIPLLRRCLALTPHPRQVYYKLARAEGYLHQTAAAERDTKIFNTLSKDSDPTPYPFGHLLEYMQTRASLSPQQREEMDLSQLLQAVKKHPDRPRTLFMLTEAYLKQGQEKPALDTVATLDQISNGDAHTMLALGVLLGRYRLYPQATRHLQAAVAADPNSDDAKYDLAYTLERQGEYSQARATWEQMSPAGRQDAGSALLRGNIDRHLGDCAGAVGRLHDLLQNHASDPEVYYSLSLAQLRCGDLNGAAETVHRGLEQVPDAGLLFWSQGVIAALQGSNKAAQQSLRRAQQLLPDWPGAYSVPGLFDFLTGQYSSARTELKAYRSTFPHGALNVEQIEQLLAQRSGDSPGPLQGDGRAQFLRFALNAADEQ